MVFLWDHNCVVYVKNDKLMKLDLLKIQNTHMKLRSSKIEGLNTILQVFKSSESSFTFFTKDYCVKLISFNEENYREKTEILGFL